MQGTNQNVVQHSVNKHTQAYHLNFDWTHISPNNLSISGDVAAYMPKNGDVASPDSGSCKPKGRKGLQTRKPSFTDRLWAIYTKGSSWIGLAHKKIGLYTQPELVQGF